MTTKYEITASGTSQKVHLKAEAPEQAATKAVKKFLSKHARKIAVTADPDHPRFCSVFNATAEEFGETKTLRVYVSLHSDEPQESNDAFM